MELACKQPNCLWPATPSHHPTGKMRTRAPALKRRHEPYGMLSMLHRQTVNPQSSQLCTHTRMLEHNNKCSEIHHQPQPLREWLTASQSNRPKQSASRHNLRDRRLYVWHTNKDCHSHTHAMRHASASGHFKVPQPCGGAHDPRRTLLMHTVL